MAGGNNRMHIIIRWKKFLSTGDGIFILASSVSDSLMCLSNKCTIMLWAARAYIKEQKDWKLQQQQLTKLTMKPLYHCLICGLLNVVLFNKNSKSSFESCLLELPPIIFSTKVHTRCKLTADIPTPQDLVAWDLVLVDDFLVIGWYS